MGVGAGIRRGRSAVLGIALVVLVLVLPGTLVSVGTVGVGPTRSGTSVAGTPWHSTGTTSHPGSIASRPRPSGSAACDGLWPDFAATFPAPLGCVGRDQAIAGFYSDVAGGAGNVTMVLTLPADRSPTANQSDLYRALWVGFALADPNAWMGECFLELRFQPDASWNLTAGGNATDPNNWTGTLVGWEFDPAAGTVDACVDEPLYATSTGNGTYLALQGGDVLNITTTGWFGDVAGESIVVTDTSSGQTSTVNGINDDGAPLDPAYATANVLDALAGSGAQIPAVAVGVELAGGANPSIPTNSSFGGCTPGIPPGTPANPSVPCPSYDPASWINDTASPLRFSAPTFTGHTSAPSSEVLFSSSIGGTTGVANLSNKTCVGRIGSAFCTYPWYSYSCGAGSFEFGATDYSGVTTDFTEQNQYGSTPVANLLGDPQFAGNAFAVPGCGGQAQNVSVGVSAGTGLVQLLGSNYTAPTGVSIASGAYAISALPGPGQSFVGWTVTGGSTVLNLVSSSTTLVVGTAGSVVARFNATAPTTNVTFSTTGGNGSFVLGPLWGNSSLGSPTTVPNGSAVALAPGSYPLQSTPAPGDGFVVWSGSLHAAVGERSAPATWLSISSSGGTGSVSARLHPIGSNATVIANATGNGTISVDGVAIPYTSANRSSFGSVNVTGGTVLLEANASPGWEFLGWSVLPGGVALPGNSTETNVTLAAGTAYAVGEFAALVTVDSRSSMDGQVSVDEAAPVSNGTLVPLGEGLHDIGAAPYGGFAFQRWLVSDPTELWVTKPLSPLTELTVNGTGTLTAVYASAATGNVTLKVTPGGGGFLEFNFANLSANPTVNTSTVVTTYELRAIANYGYRFLGWNVTGPASVVPGKLTLTGSGAVVTAKFTAKFFPVTFVVTRPGTVSMTVNGNAVASGATLGLARGVYPLTATVTARNTTFLGWSTAFLIGNVSPSHTSATVTIDGSGSVFGIVAGFVLAGFTVTPSTTDVGATFHVTVATNGTGPLTYKYFGLPPNCNSVNRNNFTCRPTASGTYPIRASVTDQGGAVELTPTVLLTVVGDPTVVSFTTDPVQTDLGVPVVLAVAVQQGLGPYSYAYTNLPPGCSTMNVSILNCLPSQTGSTLVSVTVTDSVGVAATGATSVVVVPRPAVASFVASRSSLDVGVPTYLNVTTTGGTGPYTWTYTQLPSGCTTHPTANLECTPTGAGTYNVTVTVQDGFGLDAISFVVLTVHARPTVTLFSASPANVTIGESVLFTVVASAGTGAYGYTYIGLPPGCPATAVASFRCTPSTTGGYAVTVTVVDGDGARANGSTAVTIVAVSPTGPNPSPNPTTGQGIDWTIVALFVVVALVIAIVLIWRFGRPPTPAPAAAPAGAESPPDVAPK
ncbi:MAG: hypothetical protein L3K00_00805 [Thermoplasmata archaeon]|nr:hypothetical protein [Thermoplasmata archaeon]